MTPQSKSKGQLKINHLKKKEGDVAYWVLDNFTSERGIQGVPFFSKQRLRGHFLSYSF